QGAFYYPESNTNFAYIIDPRYAQFANYIKTTRPYVCPTDKDAVNVYGKSFPKLRSYALNCYMGWTGTWDDRLALGYMVIKKQSLLPPMPAGTFLFADVNPNSICWPYFGVRMVQDSFFNWPGASHS